MAEIEKAAISGVVVVTPRVFTDDRGCFVETWRQEWLPVDSPAMVQSNRADRIAGTLVGMHYHLRQSDYWYVPFGRAFVALHDLRASSSSWGATATFEIGEHDHRGIYIPPGVAHGFYAMTDLTITYLVDRYYDRNDELGVAWDDPDMDIAWPLRDGRAPALSARDQANPLRSALPEALRPH